MAERRLRYVVEGDTASAQKALNDLRGKVKAVGQKMKSAGRKATRAVTVPIAGAAAGAAKMSADFEASMTKLESQIGLSREEVQGLEDDVRQMAVEAGKSPQEAADAMFFIQSAGLRGQEALDALNASLKASAIGMGESKEVANAVTNAMNAYGAESLSAEKATSVLLNTVQQGKAEAAELGPAFAKVVPGAEALGVSFEDVGASLATLTKITGDASSASTQLRGILMKLLKPSKQGKEALAEYGLSIEDVRQKASEDGLLSALQMLREEFGDNQEALTKVFPRSRALAGVLSMTGDSAEEAREVFDALGETTEGDLGEALKATEQTAAFQFRQAMAKMKDAAMDFGDVLLPIAKEVAGFLQRLADRISNLSPSAKRLTLVVAGLVAALGPLLWIVGSLLTSIAAISGVLGVSIGAFLGVTAAVVGLGAALVLAWNKSKTFRSVVKGAFQAVKSFISDAMNTVQSVIGAVISWATDFWNRWGQDIQDFTHETFYKVKGIVESVLTAVRGFISVVTGVIRALWRKFGSFITDFAGQFLANLAALFRATWENIKQLIDAALRVIRGIFDVFAGLLTGDWTRLWEGIKSIVSGLWSAIHAVIEQAGAILQSILRGAWETMKTVARGAWETFVTIIETQTGNALDWLRDLPTKILNAIGDLGSLLLDSGRDLIQGLIDGIEDKIDDLRGMVSEAADTVTRYWPFSPAKEGPLASNPLDEAGANLMVDLARGIESAAGEVNQATEGVAEAAVTPSATDIAGLRTNQRSVALRGSRGGQTIVVELDSEVLAEAVGDPLADEIRVRTGMRF